MEIYKEDAYDLLVERDNVGAPFFARWIRLIGYLRLQSFL